MIDFCFQHFLPINGKNLMTSDHKLRYMCVCCVSICILIRNVALNGVNADENVEKGRF